MLNPAARLLSRRAIIGVVVLWLCVMGAGVYAPIARAHAAAQGWELLCSGHAAPHWVPSPVAQTTQGDAPVLHPLMDCPLCLPWLAPPPDASAVAPSVVLSSVPEVQTQVLLALPALRWPPARGPPAQPSTPD